MLRYRLRQGRPVLLKAMPGKAKSTLIQRPTRIMVTTIGKIRSSFKLKSGRMFLGSKQGGFFLDEINICRVGDGEMINKM